MRQPPLSVGGDYWIEDEDRTRAFRVDGKALRTRQTLVFEDATGREVAALLERRFSVRAKLDIERDGRQLATVKKALVGIRDRFSIDVADGVDLDAKGNLGDPRVRDHPQRRHRCHGVQALVRGPRHLRRGNRTWAGRRPAAGDYSLHRRPWRWEGLT